MSTPLCLAPHCRKPGSHSTECQAEPDRPCRGCLPAKAADGHYLCTHCTSRLAADAVEAAALHAELGLALTARGGMTEIRVSPAQPGLAVNDDVVEHRAVIRHTLVSWTLLVTQERGIDVPWHWTPWELIALPTGVQGPLRRVRSRVVDDSTVALGKLLATHAVWLAARQLGAEAAGEMRDLVTTGRTLRQQSGTRVVEVGPCPREGEDGRCAGTLRALLRTEDNLLPSAVACDADESHSWDSTQWTKLGRTMARMVA